MSDNQQKPNDKKPLLVKKINTTNTSAINSSSIKSSNPSQQPSTPSDKVNQVADSASNIANSVANNPVISKTIKLTNTLSPVTKVNSANNQLPAKAPVKASPTLANTQATTQVKPITKTSNAPKSITQAISVEGATPAKIGNTQTTKAPSQQPSSQPSSKASQQPTQVVKAVSIAPVSIERPIADETLTKAQMDITVKISELPSEVNTNEQGIKEFYVKANERQIFIAINSKQYNKLVTAQQTWPSWIGRIAGRLGQATKDGFILDQANVQVFEKVVKTPTADNAKNQPSANNTSVSSSDKSNNNVTNSKTTGYKNNLPVTNDQYKEICKQFNPYLSKGKLPSQEEINKILSPYQLSKDGQTKLLGYLLYHQKVERQKGFLIEALYFKLLPAWDKSYSDLIKNIAKQLDIHEKLVDTWLSFIQKMPSYLDKVKLPAEDLAKEIIKMYEKYLLSETPPELGLHSWIAQSIASGLTKDQIHKVLATYRRQSRKELYDRYFAKKAEERQKLKEAQLLLDAATANNDKAGNNETSDNKS